MLPPSSDDVEGTGPHYIRFAESTARAGSIEFLTRILPLLFPVWLAPFWLPATGRLLQAAAHVVYGAAFCFAGPSRDQQQGTQFAP